MTLKDAYRIFVIPGISKEDTDSYLDQVKPHILELIEDKLKEMRSGKAIMIYG